MNQKYRVYAHGEIQQWEVNYWETYDPVVNLDKYEITIRYSKYV